MIHTTHMMIFAAIVAIFFAFLQAPRGRRVVYGLKLWGILFGAGLLVGLLMAPLS